MKHHHISFKEYTMDNLTLPSNIADLIPPDNMAHVVHEMVERIPMETFLPYYKGGGTSSYPPKMMTKIILYAYIQKMYHGREIARQLEVHLPLMWLNGFQKPDFRSINRFRSERMKGLMYDLFREMITLLVADGYVNMEDYFVDGTKIEANANRYTFRLAEIRREVPREITSQCGSAHCPDRCDRGRRKCGRNRRFPFFYVKRNPKENRGVGKTVGGRAGQPTVEEGCQEDEGRLLASQ